MSELVVNTKKTDGSSDNGGQQLLKRIQELSPAIQIAAVCLPLLLYACTYYWKWKKYTYLGIPQELIGLDMKDVALAFSLSLFTYGCMAFDWILDFRRKQKKAGIFWSALDTANTVAIIISGVVFAPVFAIAIRYGLSGYVVIGLLLLLLTLALLILFPFCCREKHTGHTAWMSRNNTLGVSFVLFTYVFLALCHGISCSLYAEIGFIDSEQTVVVAYLESGDAIIKEAEDISPDKKHVVVPKTIQIVPQNELPMIETCRKTYIELAE